jgi:hypothetical protein
MLGFSILSSVVAPVILLLALSFFISYALRKLERGTLRAFGSVINLAALVTAGLFLIVGIHSMIRSYTARNHMIQQMMKEQGSQRSSKAQH